MAADTTGDGLPNVMRQMQTLARSGQRERFAAYCREILRQYGRDTEALMRLARFCQKQKWHGGFELFMLRLAERLPGSRTGILVTLGEYLASHRIKRSVEYLRAACEALAEDAVLGDKEQRLKERAVVATVNGLADRTDWEDVVKTFPAEVRADLYLELAEQWGTERPEDAFLAYRRGLRLKPDAWPGEMLVNVALAYAATAAAGDAAKAKKALEWAADYADDPRLEAEAAAIALEACDRAEALRLSRRVFQRRPDDLDNLGRLVSLQAGVGAWGEVAALAQAVVAAVARLNPWQRGDYMSVVDLALEAWLRTGEISQAEAALKQLHIDDGWQAGWRRRVAEAKAEQSG